MVSAKSILWHLSALLPVLIVTPVSAQWTIDGVPVCTAAGDQVDYHIAADGMGGAVIVWCDDRTGNYVIYAQWIDSNGVPQWTGDGAAICSAPGGRGRPRVIVDTLGGATVVWEDYRNGETPDIYGQRLNLGMPLPGGDGFPVCTAAGAQFEHEIIRTGGFETVVTWRDDRGGVSDIYAQKLDPVGSAMWTVNGVAVCTAVSMQECPQIVTDGAGGAIIVWWDIRDFYYDIYGQRLNSSGVAQWTANGREIRSMGDNVTPCSNTLRIISDGAGGAIITWEDNSDISYVQRIDAGGSGHWNPDGWPSSDSRQPGIVFDGAAGAIMAFEYTLNPDGDIYAQRYSTGGVSQWTWPGAQVCAAAGNQDYPRAISDGRGGALILWEDFRDGSDDIYAQRIDTTGATRWSPDGLAVCTESGIQRIPELASDGSGGVIVVWRDQRGDDYDLYAGRIPVNPCMISIAAPNGGEAYCTGEEVSIEWSSAGSCGSQVRIELLQGGQACSTIVDTTADDGQYTWSVFQCGTASDDYRIRISDAGGWLYDRSDGVFGITRSEITVTSPLDLDYFQAGDTIDIAWDDICCGDSARIELVRDAQVCLTITESTPNDGSFSWPAEQCGGEPGGYKVRVTDITTSAEGESGGSFSICDFRITSIVDFGNDQGRQVRVTWQRAMHDHPETDTTVTSYSLWRQVDGTAIQAPGRAEDAGPLPAYPPGDWDFIKTVPAYGEDSYSTICGTYCDSTIASGICWSVFFVRAGTDVPTAYFDCAPDSGYSVDNLAPGVPLGFAVAYNAGGVNELSWEECSDADFQHFRIYRAETGDFEPSEGYFVHGTVGTGWTDPVEEGWRYHYKITAVDFSGNESDAASPGATTGADLPAVPGSFALYQNVPNPFNPTTTIRFDLPRAVNVKLCVYNVRGELVSTLLDRRMAEGRKEITWTARDSRGRAVSSGIYFYRLVAGDFVQMRKMVLLR